MKRHWIDYQPAPPVCPMTCWVHRAVGGTSWQEAETYAPPRQTVVAGRGYPVFHVEVDGFTFEFASLAELDSMIAVFAKKLLPRTIDLAREGGTGAGPNSHWLSRLPKDVKSWKYREKAVVSLRRAREDFEAEITC